MFLRYKIEEMINKLIYNILHRVNIAKSALRSRLVKLLEYLIIFLNNYHSFLLITRRNNRFFGIYFCIFYYFGMFINQISLCNCTRFGTQRLIMSIMLYGTVVFCLVCTFLFIFDKLIHKCLSCEF